MIRSQIPLSLPPMHRESGSTLARGGRPAVVNGPAVGVHLGGGGVREWITGVCDYRMPTPAFPTSPETGGEASAGSHLCRRRSARFPKDVMKFNVWLLRDCGHFRKEEGRGNILL